MKNFRGGFVRSGGDFCVYFMAAQESIPFNQGQSEKTAKTEKR